MLGRLGASSGVEGALEKDRRSAFEPGAAVVTTLRDAAAEDGHDLCRDRTAVEFAIPRDSAHGPPSASTALEHPVVGLHCLVVVDDLPPDLRPGVRVEREAVRTDHELRRMAGQAEQAHCGGGALQAPGAFR